VEGFYLELIGKFLSYQAQFGIFEAEDTRWDRKACVEAKQFAVAGHPSDGENLKTSKTALEGLVSLVVRKGYFRLSVASI
jgi:hypothetical protein